MKRDSRLSGVLHVLLHMAEQGGPATSESLAKAMGTNPVVIRRIMAGLREKPYPFERYIKAVCDEARAARIECLDVLPALQDSHLQATVSRIENHPSAAVYSRVAERIEKALP